MAAGLTQRQINQRVRTRLQSIQRELVKAGVQCEYQHHELHGSPDKPFRIAFQILHASNGEVFGLPWIRMGEERFDHLSFNRGMEALKAAYGQ